MNQKSNKIRLGAILSYLSIAINVASGLIYTPWMIDQIGQSQYGIYTLVTSLITLLMFDFGLSSAAAKFISNYHASNDENGANRALGAIYKLYLIVDMVIFLVLFVLFFFLDSIYIKLTSVEMEQLKVAYLIVAAYSLLSFPFVTLNGVLTAYDKFIHIKIADIIYRCVILCLMIFALHAGMGLYALVTVNAIAGMISIGYKYFAIKKTTPIRANFQKTDYTLFKGVLSFSFWITIHSLAQRLIFNITPSILGVVSNTEAIAVFGVVTTIEQYVYLLSTALNGMFMPKISRIIVGNDKDQSVMPLMINVGLFQYVLNFAIIIGFACLGYEFMLLWMGEEYIEAFIGIMLVIVPGVFYNPLQIAHTSMMIEGKAKPLAFINVIAGIVNIMLSVFLSSLYGLVGACISIMFAYIVRDILVFILYPRYINIDVKSFIKECYIKTFLPSLLCFGLCWIISNIMAGDTWIKLIIKGTILVVVMLVFAIGYYLILKRRKNGKEKS